MLGYALLDAFTPLARRPAIQRLKASVADADGVIVDFAFDETSVRFTVELEVGTLRALGASLEGGGVHLLPGSARMVEASGALSPTRPVTVLLHVALVAAEDLAKTG